MHTYHLMSLRGACTSSAFCNLIAHSCLDLAASDTERPVVSERSVTSQRGACHKYPWNEPGGTNLAPLTAAHAVSCLLSTLQ